MAKKEKTKVEEPKVEETMGLMPFLFKQFKDNFGEDSVVEDPLLSPSHIAGFYSTGSFPLDCSLGGKGLPYSKMITFTGIKSTGKTSLSLICGRSVQQDGGVIIFYDMENGLDLDFAVLNLGVNPDNILLPDCTRINTAEDLLNSIYTTVMNVIDKYGDIKILIVVDSWDAVATKDALAKLKMRLKKKAIDADESDKKKDKTNEKMMEKPSLLSQFFRNGILKLIGNKSIGIIFILQSRVKLPEPGKAMFNTDTMGSSGGQALDHYSSVKIKLAHEGIITKMITGVKQTIGVQIRTKVEKSKICAPYQKSIFNFYFDRGIDDIDTMIDTLYAKTDLVTKSGYGVKIKGVTEKAMKMENLKKLLLEEPELYSYVKSNVQKLFTLRRQ